MHGQDHLVSSEYAYRHYTTDDGLPSYSLESIYQDSKGFIWVGCSGGMARYDGFAFHRYLEGRFTNISRISENSRHEVVAYGFNLYTVDGGTDSVRLAKFPEGYFPFKNNHSKLPPEYAFLNKDHSEAKAIFRLTDAGFVKVLEHPEFEKTDMSGGRLFIDGLQERIYVPTETGISVLSTGGEIIARYPGYFARNFIQYQGTVWFVTADGLYRFKQDKVELVMHVALESEADNICLCADRKGGLLFSDNLAVYRLADNRLERIFGGVNQITDLLVDAEGNLWVATFQGLYNLFQLQFKNHWLQNRNDVVRGMVVDGNDDIVAGSYNGTLLRFKGTSAREMSYPTNEYGSFFGPYYSRNQEDLFLVGAGKVLKVKGNECRWLNLPVQNYEFVQTLSDGTLAAGGQEGIQFFTSDGKFLRTLPSDTLRQNIHSRLCEDPSGNLWCGGGRGVTVIRMDGIRLISNPSLKPALVFANDNEGNVWLASENRLLRTENDTVRLVHTYPSSIESILFTEENLLIVGTSSGIHLSDADCKNVFVYDHLNGFTGKEVMRSAMVQDRDGNVWLPSVTCLVEFNPAELLVKQLPPKLYVLSFMTSEDNVRWQKHDAGDVNLRHAENNIRFSYIGLSYSHAQNVRYQYRLLGFQDTWSQEVVDRDVTFNNLPPGHYTFELRCNAGTPETQTEAVSVPVFIKPAFWQTRFFGILMFVLLSGAIAGFVARFMKRQHGRELRKANREKEMNELRLQSIRLKSIPHFNSNVLAGIEYLIMAKSKEEANGLLTTYSRFTNITLHDIDKAQRSLKDELDYVRMYLDLEKMRYGDKLSYGIAIGEKVDLDIMVPNMVLHTYAENAVKHGIRGKSTAGKVTISIHRENGGVRISVEDDGIGRKSAALKNAETGRQGHGLSILSRQIDLYNQQNEEKIQDKVVDLTDGNGHPAGTRFELYVPDNYRFI